MSEVLSHSSNQNANLLQYLKILSPQNNKIHLLHDTLDHAMFLFED